MNHYLIIENTRTMFKKNLLKSIQYEKETREVKDSVKEYQ